MTEVVEVFRTNVVDDERARQLVTMIEDHFEGYKVNFDLDDCDHILRIAATTNIDVDPVINILKREGVQAEVLSDEVAALIIW